MIETVIAFVLGAQTIIIGCLIAAFLLHRKALRQHESSFREHQQEVAELRGTLDMQFLRSLKAEHAEIKTEQAIQRTRLDTLGAPKAQLMSEMRPQQTPQRTQSKF